MGVQGARLPAGAWGVPHRCGRKGQGDRKGRLYHTTRQPVKPVYGRGRACPCPGRAVSVRAYGGVPALSLFPKRLGDDALGRRGSVVGKRNTENGSIVAGLDNKDVV